MLNKNQPRNFSTIQGKPAPSTQPQPLPPGNASIDADPLRHMQEALTQANRVILAADSMANTMARMLIGRLRSVEGAGILAALKRELSDFSLSTHTWKGKR